MNSKDYSEEQKIDKINTYFEKDWRMGVLLKISFNDNENEGGLL